LWGSVIEKALSIVPSTRGINHCRFCSAVPYFTNSEAFPEFGATTPNSSAAPTA
jgi:hypothetical protein